MSGIYKILLLGDAHTGKSSILNVYKNDMFYDNEVSTIGVEFMIKYIDFNGEQIKLQIWDTAGQERFRSITSSYYRGSDGILLVFDITNRQSFLNIKKWINDVDKFIDKDYQKILIGNKFDLNYKREVTYEESVEFADSLDINYIETSAKDNINIENIFMYLVKNIYFKKEKKERENEFKNKKINLLESLKIKKCQC
jgi:Ras-related protein Rab-1A